MAHFSYYIQNKVSVIQIQGEIIFETIRGIKESIEPLVEDVKQGKLRGIVVDFEKVTRIDPVGFGAICAKFIALKKLNSKFRVTNLNSDTMTLFGMLDLIPVFEAHSSVQTLIHRIGLRHNLEQPEKMKQLAEGVS